MVFLFLSMFILFLVWTGIGLAIEKLSFSSQEKVSLLLLKGILGISVVWTITAFFLPLNTYVEIATVGLGILLFFYLKGYENWKLFFQKRFNASFTIWIVVILAISSCYPYILDHFGYYVPSIKWLSEVGLVKGIGNLDLILGQMSIWHIFQAGFSHFSDQFLRINALLLIVYLIYIYENKLWFHLCFLPILVAFTQSPSPDLPVIVFSLLVLNEILAKNKNLSFLFGLSCFVFAIKPTAIWLPLFCLLYGVFEAKKKLKFIWLGTFIGLLYLVKNIWTFGYPIFPMQLMDLNLDWKVNNDLLTNSSQLALEKTYDLQYSYKKILAFSWQEKIINWFTIKGIKGKIHVLFMITLVVFGGMSFIKKEKIYRWLFLTIIIKSVLVLSFSAQYRFFLDVFFITGVVVFSTWFTKKRSQLLASVLGGCAIIIFFLPASIQNVVPSFRLGHVIGKSKLEQAYQPLTYTYNTYQSFQLRNLKFNISKDYPFNFETPLPAISPSYIEEYLEIGIFPQRSKNGFIWKKLTLKEKLKLKQIIQQIYPDK